MATNAQRVIIYDRLSEDRTGDAASVENHLQACRDHAASRGWTVVAEEIDRDKSGYRKGVKRPAWDRVVRAVEQGEVDRFLAWKFDRLSRQGITFVGRLISLCDENNVTFSTVVEGDALDTSTPVGRIFISIIAELARAESESLSERQRLRHRAAAERGEMHAAGRRPYGFNYQGNVIEDEATIIREVAERLVRGESLRSITRLLNERGVPTSTGGAWGHQNLRNVMTSERLVGLRTHLGETYQGNWESILTEDQHRAVLAVCNGSKAGRRDRAGRRHLLSGLVFCTCGGPMRHATSGSGERRIDIYRCSKSEGGCGRISAKVERVDQVATEKLLSFLAAARLEAVGSVETEPVRRALEQDHVELANLCRARYVERAIPDDIFRELRSELEKRISSNEQFVTAVERRAAEASTHLDVPVGDRVALDAWWLAASAEERTDLAGWALERVEIRPSQVGGWDPSRVTVTVRWNVAWKSGRVSRRIA